MTSRSPLQAYIYMILLISFQSSAKEPASAPAPPCYLVISLLGMSFGLEESLTGIACCCTSFPTYRDATGIEGQWLECPVCWQSSAAVRTPMDYCLLVQVGAVPWLLHQGWNKKPGSRNWLLVLSVSFTHLVCYPGWLCGTDVFFARVFSRLRQSQLTFVFAWAPIDWQMSYSFLSCDAAGGRWGTAE